MKRIVLAVLTLSMASLPFTATAADLDQGKSVYVSTCAMCHNSGIAGAPSIDNKAAWKDRIAKGEDVLIRNSIDGFRGSSGFMPPKGGKSSLSEDEVANAVHYMLSLVK